MSIIFAHLKSAKILNIIFSSIDDTNAGSFDVFFGVLVFMVPEETTTVGKKSYTRKEYDRLADGTLLKDVKFNSKEPFTLRF